jgi:hypothetical protein
LGRSSVADAEGLVAIARRLLALGADANTRFPWLHHGVHRPVLWGATRETQLPALAELLLASGADPNDGVTLPMAASAGDVETLELLRAHGASPNQPWASDGAATIYAILHWSRTPVGVQWLLEHGADPDPVFAANGETPLQWPRSSGTWRWSKRSCDTGRTSHVDAPTGARRTPWRSSMAIARWRIGSGRTAPTSTSILWTSW